MISWLDPLFQGISNFFANGTQAVKERGLNLVAGTNVTITAVDNAAAARTDVTIASTGGSGSVPTGTGFPHITGGAQDGAARSVNLASSDVTGVLPAANGGFTAGGDLTGSSTSQQVTQITGAGTGLPVTFTATGSPRITLNYGASNPIAGIGAFTSSPGTYGAVWLGAVSPVTQNAALISAGSTTYLNATGNVIVTTNWGANLSLWTASMMQQSVPIYGDSSSSPYGVHGDVTTAITTTTTLSAAQYAMFIIPVAPTAAMTLTLPRAAAGAGYSKLFDVQAAFAVTITDGTHSVTLPAAIGTYEVAFTNAKLMGGTTKL